MTGEAVAVAGWRAGLGRLRDLAAGAGGRSVLLAGDFFNASQDHAAFRAVLEAGGPRDSARPAGHPRLLLPRGPAYPAAHPDRPVLVSDDSSVRSARFPRLSGTDHRALLVSLAPHGG